MNTSESIAAIAAALSKAQGSMDHPSVEADLISSLCRQFNEPIIHPGRGHARRDIKARLLERVRFGLSDCWHVVTVKNKFGYARMSYEGRTQMMHRLSYQAFVGPIPDGLSVLHRCDNRACINPQHLWLGTYSDNIIDCYTKGRRKGGRSQQ